MCLLYIWRHSNILIFFLWNQSTLSFVLCFRSLSSSKLHPNFSRELWVLRSVRYTFDICWYHEKRNRPIPWCIHLHLHWRYGYLTTLPSPSNLQASPNVLEQTSNQLQHAFCGNEIFRGDCSRLFPHTVNKSCHIFIFSGVMQQIISNHESGV